LTYEEGKQQDEVPKEIRQRRKENSLKYELIQLQELAASSYQSDHKHFKW
jgi:hypothetical protein